MSKVKLNISIPQTLSDITLGQYQDYLAVVKKNEEDENSADFLNLKALEIFCGMELKKTYNLPVKHFHFALQHLERCFSEPTPLVRHFTFRDSNGVDQEMGFIPKLDDMTAGEYMDLDTYVSDWSKMHLAMAILYRPVRVKSKDSYVIDDYNGTEVYGEAMKQMPVSIAIGALVFFYRLGIRLLQNIPSFLERHQQTLNLKKDSLHKIGDGIHQFTLYAERTLLNSIMQPKFLYTKPCRFWRMWQQRMN